MLEITNAVKVFGRGTAVEQAALQGLSLHLKPGEFATVIGSNGAGKSTLFNAICGVFLLDEGRIRLGGEDITFRKEYKRSLRIGRVFQDPMLGTAPGMTIAENLSLAHSRTTSRALHFAPTRKERELFRDRLATFGMGLEDRMNTRVGQLSGGQRQAVTLLMCTIVPPKLLLLDEHTAALDPATAEKVITLTRRIIDEEKLTCLMITHNMQDALAMGSRTLVMDAGRIVLDISGPERDVLTVGDLLQRFRSLGSDRALLR